MFKKSIVFMTIFLLPSHSTEMSFRSRLAMWQNMERTAAPPLSLQQSYNTSSSNLSSHFESTNPKSLSYTPSKSVSSLSQYTNNTSSSKASLSQRMRQQEIEARKEEEDNLSLTGNMVNRNTLPIGTNTDFQNIKNTWENRDCVSSSIAKTSYNTFTTKSSPSLGGVLKVTNETNVVSRTRVFFEHNGQYSPAMSSNIEHIAMQQPFLQQSYNTSGRNWSSHFESSTPKSLSSISYTPTKSLSSLSQYTNNTSLSKPLLSQRMRQKEIDKRKKKEGTPSLTDSMSYRNTLHTETNTNFQNVKNIWEDRDLCSSGMYQKSCNTLSAQKGLYRGPLITKSSPSLGGILKEKKESNIGKNRRVSFAQDVQDNTHSVSQSSKFSLDPPKVPEAEEEIVEEKEEFSKKEPVGFFTPTISKKILINAQDFSMLNSKHSDMCDQLTKAIRPYTVAKEKLFRELKCMPEFWVPESISTASIVPYQQSSYYAKYQALYHNMCNYDLLDLYRKANELYVKILSQHTTIEKEQYLNHITQVMHTLELLQKDLQVFIDYKIKDMNEYFSIPNGVMPYITIASSSNYNNRKVMGVCSEGSDSIDTKGEIFIPLFEELYISSSEEAYKFLKEEAFLPPRLVIAFRMIVRKYLKHMRPLLQIFEHFVETKPNISMGEKYVLQHIYKLLGIYDALDIEQKKELFLDAHERYTYTVHLIAQELDGLMAYLSSEDRRGIVSESSIKNNHDDVIPAIINKRVLAKRMNTLMLPELYTSNKTRKYINLNPYNIAFSDISYNTFDEIVLFYAIDVLTERIEMLARNDPQYAENYESLINSYKIALSTIMPLTRSANNVCDLVNKGMFRKIPDDIGRMLSFEKYKPQQSYFFQSLEDSTGIIVVKAFGLTHNLHEDDIETSFDTHINGIEKFLICGYEPFLHSEINEDYVQDKIRALSFDGEIKEKHKRYIARALVLLECLNYHYLDNIIKSYFDHEEKYNFNRFVNLCFHGNSNFVFNKNIEEGMFFISFLDDKSYEGLSALLYYFNMAMRTVVSKESVYSNDILQEVIKEQNEAPYNCYQNVSGMIAHCINLIHEKMKTNFLYCLDISKTFEKYPLLRNPYYRLVPEMLIEDICKRWIQNSSLEDMFVKIIVAQSYGLTENSVFRKFIIYLLKEMITPYDENQTSASSYNCKPKALRIDDYYEEIISIFLQSTQNVNMDASNLGNFLHNVIAVIARKSDDLNDMHEASSLCDTGKQNFLQSDVVSISVEDQFSVDEYICVKKILMNFNKGNQKLDEILDYINLSDRTLSNNQSLEILLKSLKFKENKEKTYMLNILRGYIKYWTQNTFDIKKHVRRSLQQSGFIVSTNRTRASRKQATTKEK